MHLILWGEIGHRERKEAEGDVRQLAASAQGVQRTRTGLAGDLDKLQAELEQAEKRTAAKQREYLQARDVSQNLAQRVNDIKCACPRLSVWVVCMRACYLTAHFSVRQCSETHSSAVC